MNKYKEEQERIRKSIANSFVGSDIDYSEDIRKARYVNNPQNKKLGRVGQEYGGKGKKEEKSGIPKELKQFAEIAKKVSTPEEFIAETRKITNVHPDTANMFHEKYGTSKEGGSFRTLSMKQAAQNFMDAVNKESKSGAKKPSDAYPIEDIYAGAGVPVKKKGGTAKKKYEVVNNEFNRKHYPDMIGKQLDSPPSYARVKEVVISDADDKLASLKQSKEEKPDFKNIPKEKQIKSNALVEWASKNVLYAKSDTTEKINEYAKKNFTDMNAMKTFINSEISRNKHNLAIIKPYVKDGGSGEQVFHDQIADTIDVLEDLIGNLREQEVTLDNLPFESGHGYWDVTKYPYGGDFKRFKGGEKGKVIKGPVKKGDEIRVELTDGRQIVVAAAAIPGLDMDERDALIDKSRERGVYTV